MPCKKLRDMKISVGCTREGIKGPAVCREYPCRLRRTEHGVDHSYALLCMEEFFPVFFYLSGPAAYPAGRMFSCQNIIISDEYFYRKGGIIEWKKNL